MLHWGLLGLTLQRATLPSNASSIFENPALFRLDGQWATSVINSMGKVGYSGPWYAAAWSRVLHEPLVNITCSRGGGCSGGAFTISYYHACD